MLFSNKKKTEKNTLQCKCKCVTRSNRNFTFENNEIEITLSFWKPCLIRMVLLLNLNETGLIFGYADACNISHYRLLLVLLKFFQISLLCRYTFSSIIEKYMNIFVMRFFFSIRIWNGMEPASKSIRTPTNNGETCAGTDNIPPPYCVVRINRNENYQTK